MTSSPSCNRAAAVWPAPARLLTTLLGLLCAAPAGADGGVDFVEALRGRGLDRLAELQCQRLLKRPELPPREAAAFLIQLSLIEVDRAAAARSDREAHWERADEHLRAPPAGRGASDAWLLLRVQAGLNRSTRGRLERATGDPSAAATLITGTSSLEQSAERIDTLRRSGSRVFSQRELDALGNRVTLARAENGRRLALCHPAGSPDRDEALLRAAEAARALAADDRAGGLRWRALLLLVQCERLLGRAADALARLEAFADKPGAEAFAGAIAAERWRLLRAAGRDPDAGALLATASFPDSAEWSLARVESLSERWRAASGAERDPLATDLQRRLLAGRRRHGGLWAARAERLAGEALAASSGGSVDGLVATAEYLYRAGRTAEAVDAYDRAAGVAYRDGATGRAFELARTSASLVRKQGDPLAASERLRRAALANSQRVDAAATHRLALICAAEAVRSSRPGKATPSREGASEAYRAMLAEHLRAWPGSPTAADARWWMVKWRAGNGEWRGVIDALADIPPASPHHPEAVRLLGRAYSELVDAAGQEATRAALVAEATSRLQPTITGADNRWPAAWSGDQRETALVLARLNGGGYAGQMLAAAIDGAPAPSESWRRRALVILVPGLVDAGLADQALRRVQAPPLTDRQAAERLLQELQKRLGDAATQQAAARVMLGVITVAASPSGEPATGNALWKAPYAAAALAATGRTADAVRVYRQLLERFPREAALRLKLADLLSRSDAQADQREALAGFAAVERAVSGGGDRWWEARLGRLRVLVALGQTEQAGKLLRLTKTLRTDLRGHASELAQVQSSLAEAGRPRAEQTDAGNR